MIADSVAEHLMPQVGRALDSIVHDMLRPRVVAALDTLGPRRVGWGYEAFRYPPSGDSVRCFCARAFARQVGPWRWPSYGGYARLGLTRDQWSALDHAYESHTAWFRGVVDEWLAGHADDPRWAG